MQSDVRADNSRSVKNAFEILYQDENSGHDHGVCPVAPLKGRNDNGWYPADDDADIRNHRQDDNEHTNQRGKIETWPDGEHRPNEYAVDKTNQQLASKIRRDVTIDFR